MSKRLFIFAALAVALIKSVALGGMIYSHGVKLKSGKEVVLKSLMRDPRDLFRGHYTRLRLDLGEMKLGEIEVVGNLKHGQPVFVELEKTDDLFWTASVLHAEIPTDIKSPFLKGEMGYIPRKPSNGQTNARNQDYRISLPIDRYFADKTKALGLEKVQRDQKLGVILSIDGSGHGRIKGITIDGKLLYEESVF